jgi:hypothetical protein
MACLHGHLDEVPWQVFVHRGREAGSCPAKGKPPYLRLVGLGGSLAELRIECPIKGCGAKRSMTDLYRESREGGWNCTGRHPQREGQQKEPCDTTMEVIQRGAAALYFSETRSAVTIADHGIGLGDLLRRLAPLLLQSFNILKDVGKEPTRELVCKYLPPNAVRPFEVEEIRERWDEALPEIERIVSGTPDTRPLKHAELERLEKAAREGAPKVQSRRRDDPPLFEVPGSLIRVHVPGPGGKLFFRIAPVTRLREVVVQLGFRRVKQNPLESRLVETRLDVAGQGGAEVWYPGVERFGEGVFLSLADESRIHLTGPRAGVWLRRFEQDPPEDPENPYRFPRHPLEVWWHTLSHRLIRALAFDSGYGSASIRERVYLVADNGELRSGLLLYAVQSGGDGTLGGLTALVPAFERVLELAMQDVDNCSNDPLCEETVTAREDNGAACFACLYASETSCEFRNRGLDRLLLLESLP